MDGIYVIIYLVVLVIFWRWWTVPIVAVILVGGSSSWAVWAWLALHVVGLVAERHRKKRKKAQAGINTRQVTESVSTNPFSRVMDFVRNPKASVWHDVGICVIGALMCGGAAAIIGATTLFSLGKFSLKTAAPVGLIIGAGVTGAIAAYGLSRFIRQRVARHTNGSFDQPLPKMQAQEQVVDINTGSREELLTLPGIGAAEAGLILKRTQSGQGFGSLDELEEYLRLKPHKTSQLRGKVRFSSRAANEAQTDGEANEFPKPRTGRVID
jgi:hypothetical protein